MGQAKLLDCTLRDGAYLVDKHFGNTVISGVIAGLIAARIDYIEIGFLQDDGFGEGKTVFKDAADAKRFIPKDKQGCEFSVLADYSRYDVNSLDACTGESIDIVRECFFKHERFDAIRACHAIKEKGYKVFVQPVDILGYTDIELIELIELVNQLEPYCFSIVDTFGSMYEEDLQRVYSIINHNLVPGCQIGFHSHNNMQMSSALSQSFLRMSHGKREVVVDGTISGMGRGAGNTPTELIAEYMVSKLGYHYDMNALLDIIDSYMDNIRSKCSWGYTTPYFIAGCYSAHVNNVTYLTRKNSIRSKDIRYILNKIGASARKRYHYDLLEQTYMDYLKSDIDDSEAMKQLNTALTGRHVVVIAPGGTSAKYQEEIAAYAKEKDAVVITVNFIHDAIPSDFVYMSNTKRFAYWEHDKRFAGCPKILTSNVTGVNSCVEHALVVSFARLVKCGWEHLDNSTIMLLRLLDETDAASIALAGFDGYNPMMDGSANYASPSLELSNVKDNPLELNREIEEMLVDYRNTRRKNTPIGFITPSRFSAILERA